MLVRQRASFKKYGVIWRIPLGTLTRPPTALIAYALLIGLIGGVMGGCAPTLSDRLHSSTLSSPISKGVLLKVDVEASEILWEHKVNVDQFRPQELRKSIGTYLEFALNQADTITHTEDAEPIRYRLEVHDIVTLRQWWIVPCLIYFTLVGCPTHSQSAQITLSLEFRDQVYSVSTHGKATFNLYSFFSFSGRSELSPVADALGRAVPLLADQIRRRNGGISLSQSPPLKTPQAPRRQLLRIARAHAQGAP